MIAGNRPPTTLSKSQRRARRHARTTSSGLAAAGMLLASGCGSQTRPATAPARPAVTSLNTSLTTQAGTWAVVVMGGSATEHNNLWQLFTRSAGSTTWKLITRPGTAGKRRPGPGRRWNAQR